MRGGKKKPPLGNEKKEGEELTLEYGRKVPKSISE